VHQDVSARAVIGFVPPASGAVEAAARSAIGARRARPITYARVAPAKALEPATAHNIIILGIAVHSPMQWKT
jgi:hypothetical protein